MQQRIQKNNPQKMLKIAITMFSLFVILTKCSVLIPCAQPCLACAQSGACLKCMSPYILYQSNQGASCLKSDTSKVVSGCGMYGKKTNNNDIQCVKCQASFVLEAGQCVKKGKICVKVDQIGQCVQCEKDYQLVGNQCLSTKINQCPIGHFPHIKYCKKYPSTNCLTKNQQICQKCTSDSTLIHGTCLPQKFKSLPLTSSKQCPRNTIKLTNTTCLQFPQQKLPQFCTLSVNNIHCSICAYPYTPIDGICYLPVKVDDVNCNVYDSRSGKCTGCNRGYVLNRDNYCVRVFQFTKNQQNGDSKNISKNSQNIKKQGISNKICDSVKSQLFFQLWQAQCYYKDRNCEKIDAKTYQCTWCIQGYILNAGKCQRRQKCTARDSKNLCTQCIPQYWLHPTKQTCEQKPPNCLTPSPVSNKCLTCTPPYILSNLSQSGSSICTILTANCLKYNKYGICITCNQSYYLSSRECLKRAQNCLYAHSTEPGLCMICVQGYHVQKQNHQCYANVKDCLKYNYNDVGVCVQCVQNHVVYKGQCVYVDQYCTQVQHNQDNDSNSSKTTSRCVKCSDELVPVGSTCVYYQPFCKMYGPDRLCNQTYQGFNIKHNISSQSKQQYRLFILSASASSLLSSSSSTDSTKTRPTSKLLTTTTGHYNQNGLITFFPSITISHSIIKSIYSNLSITQCQPGYTLIKQVCIKAETTQQNPNCLQFSYITNQCILCDTGYDMNQKGICILRNKSTCSIAKQNQCIKCNAVTGYFNAGGWCINKLIKLQRNNKHFQIGSVKVMWPLINNCQQQLQINKCILCDSGYRYIQGQCVKYQRQCSKYHMLGFCVACKTGYMIYGGICMKTNCVTSATSTDIQSQYCKSCPQLFAYSSGRCQPQLQQNCLTPPQYSFLTPYKSLSCQLCKSGYYLTFKNNSCLPLPLNCAYFNISTQVCTVCNHGFVMVAGSQCVKEVNGCKKYEGKDNKCVACFDDQQGSIGKYQVIDQSTCVKLPYKCTKLNNKSPISCAQCQKDYLLYQTSTSTNQCVLLLSNCQSYDKTGRCTKCSFNFTLRNNKCDQLNNSTAVTTKIIIANCNKLLNNNSISTNNKCSVCQKGYNLTNDGLACVASVTNCKQYHSKGCYICVDGYYLNQNNGQCIVKPNNCLTYSASDNKCQKCTSEYLPYNDACVLKTTITNGCKDYKQQQPFICLSCQQGFTLKNNLCYANHCLTYTAERNCQKCPQYYKKSVGDGKVCMPHFCVKYSSGSKCQVYEDWYQGGYVIHSSGRISIQYCTQYSRSSSNASPSCIKCESNRYPSSLSSSSPLSPLSPNISICFPYNCLNSTQYSCKQCKIGFKLDPKTGICSAQACLYFVNYGSSRCKICHKGYVIDEQYHGCISNGICAQYGSQDVCIKCGKYYTLIDGQCYATNCDTLQRISYTPCIKCKQGYTMSSNNSCILLNCLQQQTDSTCLTCAPQYILHPSTLTCIPKNCLQYQYQYSDRSIIKCTKCMNNFKINITDFTCHADHCLNENNQQCTLCQTGYYSIVKNKVNYGCVLRSCLTVDNYGVCTSCQQSYTLNNKTKICQAVKLTLPSKPSSLTSQIKRINCLINSPLTCLKCLDGYYVNEKTGGFCRPVNCKTMNIKNYSCDECIQGFYKDNNHSICMDVFCVRYTSDYECQQCKKGYTINSNKLCQLITNTCLSGYHYNQKLQKCEPLLFSTSTPLNCKQTQLNNPSTVCIQCIQEYYLNRGECISWEGCAKATYEDGCQLCDTGLVLLDGRCLHWKDLCSKWQQDNNNINICVQCRIGAELSEQGQCYLKPSITYTTSQITQPVVQTKIITQMSSKIAPSPVSHELINQDEISYIDNCMFQDDIKQMCTICNSDYYITVKGKCLPMPDHCIFVNDRGICFNCQQGYMIKGNICVQQEDQANLRKST